jgi:hypothetical protein
VEHGRGRLLTELTVYGLVPRPVAISASVLPNREAAVSIKLGMFMMPFHHPSCDYAATLEEDREAIVLTDRLGFSEVFVGDHFTSWSERISSPLMFVSTVIDCTQQIRLGTGVINLPQTHPLVVAQAAMFDHLCRGRFIMRSTCRSRPSPHQQPKKRQATIVAFERARPYPSLLAWINTPAGGSPENIILPALVWVACRP